MKKFLFVAALALGVLLVGCDDSDKEEDRGNSGSGDTTTDVADIVVSLNVTGIADNSATVSVSLTKGEFYGARLVEAENLNYIGIDYTSEAQLINYVRDNGVDIDLPYTNTLTGLRADDNMISAVIVFDADGKVSSSSCVDYKVWTVVGDPESWSDDNDAGHLDENEW